MSEARITWLSGPVLRAAATGAFAIHEAVQVGPRRLLGEVIRLEGDTLVVQVYEDTSGLRPGDSVTGSGGQLSVRLGPALLGRIFDGLLRPLADGAAGEFVRPGFFSLPAQRFPFVPEMTAGTRLGPGARFGRVEPAGGRVQPCRLPPGITGEVVEIAAAGEHLDDAPLLSLRGPDGVVRPVAMSHTWPVRIPRPARRLPTRMPLITGQRILDALFPITRGGTAALPGGFGTGKTVLQESLARHCDADIIVYVGCGERGNEMAGVLHHFPRLTDPRTGRPLMERTVIIANTSNMPVSAREASIYTGITVAEYFRDQGLHVALMADSTSRWAEALREISGRLGELPAESGYPAYLSSRLAGFYERAGRVETPGGGEGSLTLIGAISPPSGDFSEPVTTHTRRYVRCFWALDRGRAQARFYPAIHPLTSYSEEVAEVEGWWVAQGNPEWAAERRRFLALLDHEAQLLRMARIVGKESLPAGQQLELLAAEVLGDGFLRQSSLSATDAWCSPARQIRMMRLVARFITLAEQAVARGVEADAIAGLAVVRDLRRMGEEIGNEMLEKFDALSQRLEEQFAGLGAEDGHAA